MIKRVEVWAILVDESEQSLAFVVVFESLVVLKLLAQFEVCFVFLQEVSLVQQTELASGDSHHSYQCFLTVLCLEQVPEPQVNKQLLYAVVVLENLFDICPQALTEIVGPTVALRFG